MSEWLPIYCADCGAVVGAAPPGRAPALSVCAECIPGIVRTAIRASDSLDPDLRAELFLPVRKDRRYA